MIQGSSSGPPVTAGMRWLPLVVIGSAGMVIFASFSAPRISIGPIIADFGASTTNVWSALVAYSLVTAALLILASPGREVIPGPLTTSERKRCGIGGY